MAIPSCCGLLRSDCNDLVDAAASVVTNFQPLVVFAVLLEDLQRLTPHRSPNFFAALHADRLTR
jgi:hypothetical protein